jgi:DNA-binding NarL/FixJ family response regulator
MNAAGGRDQEIAGRDDQSARTVETHVQNILTKTGYSTRSQVAAWYAGTQKYSGPEALDPGALGPLP